MMATRDAQGAVQALFGEKQALTDPKSILKALVRRFDEPPSFTEVRLKALQACLEAPLPERVAHLWRYTDPRLFLPSDEALTRSLGGSSASFPEMLERLLAQGELSAAVLVDGTGRTQVRLSPELAKKGVRVLDLREALKEKGDWIQARLGSIVGSRVAGDGAGKFEALNLGLWSAGTLVHVPGNVQVEKPIHVWLRAPDAEEAAFFATRLLVVAEERSELTVIDESEGGGGGLKLNSVVEVIADQGARVRHVAVQRLEKSVHYHVAQRVKLGRDASLLTAIASLGSAVTKSDFGSYLEGPGSNVELVGFLFGEGRQHFDHHTVHDHRSGHTYSDLDFKVVLKDRARSAYTGLIRIEPHAPDSEAYQENRNLLLNDGARAESIPELEILTDEVKCTHGATMGTLDQLHIFYLMSRGIPRAEAIRLIVGGFIEPTLSLLPEDLSHRLRSHVEDRVKSL
jgi:Fe-S cluster assembly protein SufD